MEKEKLVKEWFALSKQLVRYSQTTIDEEIRRTQTALNGLVLEKEHGVLHKKHVNRIKEIEGIPIVYNHGTKKIALARKRVDDENAYERDMEIVLRWLWGYGFKPDTSCKTVEEQKGDCEK